MNTQQIAELQAREAKLRTLFDQLLQLAETSYVTTSTLEAVCRRAIDQPTDDTALREMIAKAGEVMREKCADSAQDEMDEQHIDSSPWHAARACREAIRALPGVTLEDLQK